MIAIKIILIQFIKVNIKSVLLKIYFERKIYNF